MIQKYTSNKIYYQSTIALAGPVVISQLGHTLVQTVDTIIIGHFAGTTSLAAVSLVHSVFMVVLVIGLGIAYGLTPLIAQENGKLNYVNCAKLLSNSLWLNIASAILLFILVYFGSAYAMQHAGQDPEVVKTAQPYLLILSLSILPLMIFQTFKQFAEGLGFTKQAMKITIWGNVLNIILAVILVKGMFGIAPMGVKGVGIATLIDRFLMMVIMAWYVLRSPYFKMYLQNFSLKFIDFSKIVDVVKIGLPVAMQYVFEIGAFAVAALMAGQLGSTEQAAHQTAITLVAMTYMMASGIASSATIKVGHSLGKQNFNRLQNFAKASYHLVVVFMLFFAVIFMVFNKYLPYLITGDAEVLVIASQLLIIAGIFQIFDGTQVVGLGSLRGVGDVNIPTLITFISYWLIGLPVSYLLGVFLHFGINGIWYGLTVGLLASSVLLYFRFKHVSYSIMSN
ncbi:MATE family efflux transporter [Chryseobacterium balustinum]|uniref:Multidrug-efflux transporter n=1 Tax=Chryseobacterium balustinum TaxID=246 RepID=A0AAX2ITM2_9FLAO|nr:MATE family efflux transporter [Chryseobacterium balustinum]AZB28406.1 MATE family efflux transporter [Chryseobacterium balustinum]SKC04322.1 multidrug resistance protein, MATE family [Chryseobacterium balustinum]SQA92636.1 Na(+)/drug antiporter [Chryseobacterium balustinum]